MGLDQWWSTGDGVSGKVVHQVVQQGSAIRLSNTDAVPIRTITPGPCVIVPCGVLFADMGYLGKARGKLIGGNLSVFSAMIGSPYLTLDDMKGAILFLEGSSTTFLGSPVR